MSASSASDQPRFTGHASLGRLGSLRLRAPGRLPSCLALLCLGLAFAQRTGLTVTDTRIDLSVNPSLFLARATQVFSGTGDLGHVQSGQFVGYLLPMGPFYALAHAIGVPTWIAQRLWLALLLFAAGYGVVRLLDALLDTRRGSAHAVAAVLYAINPFVIVYASRATVSLLALVALPWLMLAVARGVHEPRSWRWPAAVGVLGALSGGGVNAAQVAWIALAPIALLIWEATRGGAGWGAVGKFGARSVACGLAACAWWIVPGILQGSYGANFLGFTEQPSTIWATTSVSESLRLLGYWPMYLGIGYGGTAAVMRIGQTYLFDPVVILGSFVVPGVALLGLRSTRRWFYAPFFGLLACAAVTFMAAGFPHGTALSRVLSAVYTNLPLLRFLRTSYKAGPVLALSLAVLGGLAAQTLVEHVRARAVGGEPAPVVEALANRVRRAGARRRILMAGSYLTPSGIGLALLACAPIAWALPLFTGHAIDRQLAYGSVPRAWTSSLTAAESAAGENARTFVLPGELYGYYTWGRTWDSVAPALAKRPVAIRQVVPYADPRSAELLDAVDDQVQQDRLVPGELPTLLRLLGVSQVLVATDALDSQSGGLDPADVAASLAGQPGFSQPVASYGPSRVFVPVAGRDGPSQKLPEVRRYGVSGVAGLVHLDAAGPATILDGGPDGVIELAADGALKIGQPLFYAPDLNTPRLDLLVREGARLVFSDSNRRQVVAASYVQQDAGATLTPTAAIPAAASTWNLFPAAGVRAETVAAYGGLANLTAPQPTGAQLFPAFRPFSALDGDPSTAWLPDPSLASSQRWMELTLARPRAIGTITIVPKPVVGTAPLWVAISVNGEPEREVLLQAGPNTVAIDAAAVHTLRFRLSRVTGAQLLLGGGGLSEIEIPGLTPLHETLALPTLLASATHRLNTTHNEFVIALTRTTADFPTRVGTAQGTPLARIENTAHDAETGIRRTVVLPASRKFSVSGWATVSPAAPDAALDSLTGSMHGWTLSSSSRFEGLPSSRASSAFDSNRDTAWVGDLVPASTINFAQDTAALPLAAAAELVGSVTGAPASTWDGSLQAPLPWIAVHAPHPVELRRIRIIAGAERYASPAVVQLVTAAGTTKPISVHRDGGVTLPRPVRTNTLTIRIIRVHPPTGLAGKRLLRAVSISEVVSPFHPPRPRRTGTVRSPCGALSVAGPLGTMPLAVEGTVGQFDQNVPLRLVACGRSRDLLLPSGTSTLTAPAGNVFRPDHLLLDSPPPRPLAQSAAGATTATDGLNATGVPRGAAIHTVAPAWLVLGESYSRGWRAFCSDGAGHQLSLGAPVPIDGYANGWPITAACKHATFQYAPQNTANASYIVSLVALPVLLLLLVFPRRRRQREPLHTNPLTGGPSRLFKLGWLGALSAGAAATIVIGFLFGLPIGPLAVPILRRGTTPRRLFTLGGALLLAIPLAYLIRQAPNAGGYNFSYAYDNLVGHWLAVAGICAVAGGCVLQLLIADRRGHASLISALNARHPPELSGQEPDPASVSSP